MVSLDFPTWGYHLDFQVRHVSAQARASGTFGKVTQAQPSGRCREFQESQEVWLAALRPSMVCPVSDPPLRLALSEADFRQCTESRFVCHRRAPRSWAQRLLSRPAGQGLR